MTRATPRKAAVEEVGKAEDPPTSAVHVGVRFSTWQRRVQPLVEHPGNWHLLVLTDIKNTAQSAAGRVQSGKNFNLPGHFEAAWGLHPSFPDKYGVWGCYHLPEEKQDDDADD